MTALSAPRTIERRGPINTYGFGVKAGAVIIQGGLVCLLSGYAIAAKTGADSTEAGNMQCVGVAYEGGATGSATNGEIIVEVMSGEFPFKNSSAGDAITVTEIGKAVYVVDDQTVAKTSATNTRCIAGRVTGIDADGTVWVRVGPGLAA
jgi:hypothetical protein